MAGEAINLVSESVKGQATALAETDYGKYEQTINSLGDSYEDLGKGILEAGGKLGVFRAGADIMHLLTMTVKNSAIALSSIGTNAEIAWEKLKLLADNRPANREKVNRKILELEHELTKSEIEVQENRLAYIEATSESVINITINETDKVKDIHRSVTIEHKETLEERKANEQDYMALAINDYYNMVDAKKEADDEAARSHDEYITGIERGTNQAFGTMTDTLFDFAKTGKLEFKDMVGSILEDIARMVFELTVTIPAAKALSSAITLNANGNAFEGGSVTAFADGGAFTNSVVSSPTLAPMALFGEAGPEAIMPLTRGSDGKLGVQASGSGGGGSTVVNIINNSSSEVSAQQDGDTLNVVIEATQNAIASNIRRNTGPVGDAMQSTYNLRR